MKWTECLVESQEAVPYFLFKFVFNLIKFDFTVLKFSSQYGIAYIIV